MSRIEPTYHTLLPTWAQDMLRRAGAVEPTETEPRARDMAVERATHEIRLRLPGRFKPERGSDRAQRTQSTCGPITPLGSMDRR